MAKRKSLKDKLRSERASKNTTKLASKISLQKEEKNIDLIAKQADTLHTTPNKVESEVARQKVEVKPTKKVTKAQPSKPKRIPVDKKRLTLWLPNPILKSVKVHVASKEMKLTDYFTELIKKDLNIK